MNTSACLLKIWARVDLVVVKISFGRSPACMRSRLYVAVAGECIARFARAPPELNFWQRKSSGLNHRRQARRQGIKPNINTVTPNMRDLLPNSYPLKYGPLSYGIADCDADELGAAFAYIFRSARDNIA